MKNTSNEKQSEQAPKMVECEFCGKMVETGNGHTRHILVVHPGEQ